MLRFVTSLLLTIFILHLHATPVYACEESIFSNLVEVEELSADSELTLFDILNSDIIPTRKFILVADATSRYLSILNPILKNLIYSIHAYISSDRAPPFTL